MDSTASRIWSQNQDTKGVEDVVADHLNDEMPIRDSFLDEQLFFVQNSP